MEINVMPGFQTMPSIYQMWSGVDLQLDSFARLWEVYYTLERLSEIIKGRV